MPATITGALCALDALIVRARRKSSTIGYSKARVMHMATKTICDCQRAACGLEVVGRNAGNEPITVGSKGFRFQVTLLPGAAGKTFDFRPSCVQRMVAEGELISENGESPNGIEDAPPAPPDSEPLDA